MPQLGLGSSLRKGGGVGRTYIKDGLKLYMPYRGSDASEVQFVGTGSGNFNGSSTCLTMGFLWNGTNALNDSLSISMWIKPDDALNQLLGSSDGNDSVIMTNATTVTFSAAGNSISMTHGHTFTVGEWQHFALVRDTAGKVSVYRNGVPPTATGSRTGIFKHDYIGRDQSAYYGGSMCQFHLQAYELKDSDVMNIVYKKYEELSGVYKSGRFFDIPMDDSTDPGKDYGTVDTGSSQTDLTVDDGIYGGNSPVIPRGIDNAPTVQADAIGAGSALFDGTDDYIGCGGDIDITGAFTISAWINTDTIGTALRNIVCQGNSYFGLDDSAGGILLYQGQGSSGNNLKTQTALVADTWYHIALTVAGTSAGDGKIYIDGVRDDDNATTVFMAAGDFVIGKMPDASSRYWDGNISQVGIWDAVLTQAQIQSIMEKTYEELISSEKTDLVSWYPLDAVTNLAAGSSNVKDSHGSNHGTLA